jgi:predicted negative regulator of RcsB-dependent stress response
MFGKNNTRWFVLLALAMLGLRIGYKYYRSQQRPAYEAQMEDAQARQQRLVERIKADQDAQRAQGAAVVVADSAVLAADTATRAN